MADITERDKNNLWAEMPPSGKKRLQQENSQPKPAPENIPDKKTGRRRKCRQRCGIEGATYAAVSQRKHKNRYSCSKACGYPEPRTSQ